ncbi:MAG: cytidyltransferase [Pseudonocardia sp.]|nr:cytidyltransferase [Pseudonocardia sp.]
MSSRTAISRRVRLWHDLAEIPAGWGPCVVTIGVFDGVHRGHRHLIDRAVREGRDRGLPTVLVTFDPHPARVLGIDRDTAALSTVERRAELVADLGVDAVCVLRFTRDLASLSAQDFAEQILARTLNARAVVVGANFTFGARGAGDLDALRQFGEQCGFAAYGVGLVAAIDTTACSSTYTRRCVRTGDLSEATRTLGRPHRVDGYLHCGVLTVAANTSLPPPGHYAGTVDTHPAVIEVTDQHTLDLHTTTSADEQFRAVSVTFHDRTGLPAQTSII